MQTVAKPCMSIGMWAYILYVVVYIHVYMFVYRVSMGEFDHHNS